MHLSMFKILILSAEKAHNVFLRACQFLPFLSPYQPLIKILVHLKLSQHEPPQVNKEEEISY